MVESSIQRLDYLCNVAPDLLNSIPEVEFSHKSSPEKWSKKEILGHLIDSATNNHQRFVRVQFENVPAIICDQVNWNRQSRYNLMDGKHLIEFWTIYNRHLISLIELLSEEDLQRECDIGKDETVTLQWLIVDYLQHLEHHLKQIVEYSMI
ncbi:DinB family protein [Bacteroidota bacterium]